MDQQAVILPTTGMIAKQFKTELHKVDYVVDRLGLTPSGRAGHLRIFSAHDVARIGEELSRIRQSGRGPRAHAAQSGSAMVK